ncbi:hypothetical protein NLI96_g1998 [Meripilus lineatus]|uniref:Uncharacterized protein n=1 Tax=Meripilus lineatus TaxID=2056292 RepID=A0AAD5V9I1_9APHY|nr:hypothetical protein NLI96_g1998 [Physisporinus lineatus]
MFIRSRPLSIVSPEGPTPVSKVKKSQKSGLLARLFASKFAKSAETITPSNSPTRPASPAPSTKLRSSPSRDSFVEDVKRALFAQMRSTAGKVVFNPSTPSRSPTPDLIFGTSSGYSTPISGISSGVCTPVSTRSLSYESPAIQPAVKRYRSWRSVASAPAATSPELSPRPIRPLEVPKAANPTTKPLQINKAKVRPCQSKSSQWRRNACTPSISPTTPSSVSVHRNAADELLILKSLKPLPRFNPFLRPRAESMSSIIDATRRKRSSDLASSSGRPRRHSTMSSIPVASRTGFGSDKNLRLAL